jgi:hypothetical protein
MTEVIRHEQASLEHMLKQPRDRRYALECMVSRTPYEIECDSINRMGHLGDFPTYSLARQFGIEHPHEVIIRFYPDEDHRYPSDDFRFAIQEQRNSDR